MPQPNPARQSYDSILHGKWWYRDMNGTVVVLKQEDAQAFMNRTGDDSLLTTSQPETMRHGKRSEQGPACLRPTKRVRTMVSDIECLRLSKMSHRLQDIEDKVSGSEDSRETA